MQYTFSKTTDEQHKIKVDSNLLYAVWKSGCARGGADADFEVRTSFVGQGADIEITGKGDDYGKIKKIKDKIHNNRYNGKMPIPKDITPGDNVWFEVKLSKQGLKGKSNIIPGMPEPALRKIQWDKKEARRGDIVKLQAELEQVADDTEAFVIIYEYDQDGSHDKIVTIPTTIKNRKIDIQWEYEYHEDVDEIPTDEEMKKYGKNYNPPEYFFVIDIDGYKLGEKQESGLLEFKDWIEITFKNKNNIAIPNLNYVVKLPDGKEKKGKLNSEGYAKIDGIPPGQYEVDITE